MVSKDIGYQYWKIDILRELKIPMMDSEIGKIENKGKI